MYEILFIIGLLLGAHIYAFIRIRKEKKSGSPLSKFSKLLAIAIIIADGVVIALFLFVISLFEPNWNLILCYVLIGLLILGLVAIVLFQWFDRRILIIWPVLTMLTIAAIFGLKKYDKYLESITYREYFNPYNYLPFEKDSPVKTLDHPATLCFDDDDVLPKMDGATALYPVYAAFSEAVYPESLRDVLRSDRMQMFACSTTSYAYERIVDGECDIIFVAGPSKKQEEYAKEKGVELIYTPIGKEAFVFFVHPDNPVSTLSLHDIRSIYSGEVQRWDQLGVSGLGKILAFQREEGSGSQTALERMVMQDTPLMPKDMERVVSDMGGIIDRVSSYKNHRNAIGFSFRFYCTELMKDFDVKLVAIDGVEPTVENIENGSYPLANSFYAVTRADASENTKKLLNWIQGSEGQELIRKVGYTPITMEP